jgi:hypothetical protein
VAGGQAKTPWVVAGIAGAGILMLLLVILVRREPRTEAANSSAAPFASSSGATPPDISNMTPRERFDRLYNKVMAAAESGDNATGISRLNSRGGAGAPLRFHDPGRGRPLQ